LVNAGLATFAEEALTRLTVSVEEKNMIGRRFYERMSFAETRELTQELQGYSLKLIEYRRPIS
jgi:hypothetical protein